MPRCIPRSANECRLIRGAVYTVVAVYLGLVVYIVAHAVFR